MLFWIQGLLDARTVQAFRERIDHLPFKAGVTTLSSGVGGRSFPPPARSAGRPLDDPGPYRCRRGDAL